MPPPFTIRTARPDDAPLLARLHVDSWRETYRGLAPDSAFGPEALARREQQWPQFIARAADPAHALTLRVATLDDRPIGFAQSGPARRDATGTPAHDGTPPPRDTELHMLYVLASAHGTGVGQSLLDAVLGDAPAYLWVASANPRARAFYARNGFRPDGAHHIDPRWPALVEVRMVR